MEEKKMLIRRARRTDAQGIYEIRNSPSARSNSRNKEAINFASHKKWFDKKYFKEEDNYCIVAEKEKKILGYCRFDLIEGNYLVSIAIHADYQGKSIGSLLLSEALKFIKTDKDILAEIELHNIPSIRLFNKNNFQVCRQTNSHLYLKHV